MFLTRITPFEIIWQPFIQQNFSDFAIMVATQVA